MGSSSEKIRSFHAADEGCRFFYVAKIHGSDDGTATSWNYQRNGDRKGITLIVGGGYHGKSTLLKALESGVYNHIAGDGREYVITDDSAVKLQAEDGRSIQKQIFPCLFRIFRMEKNTTEFYTEDASGSTSQAANTVEAMEAGSTLFFDR